jgi:hypothetical protein
MPVISSSDRGPSARKNTPGGSDLSLIAWLSANLKALRLPLRMRHGTVGLLVRGGVEQVQPMFVDTAQIAAPQCDAVTIEEFQDLDRYFSPVVEAIAELRRSELAVRSVACKVDGDFQHFGDGGVQKKVVMGDFVDFAHAADELEQSAHLGLGKGEDRREIANPRRPIPRLSAQQRLDVRPCHGVLRGEPYLVTGRTHPRAIQFKFAGPGQILKRDRKGGRRLAAW